MKKNRTKIILIVIAIIVSAIIIEYFVFTNHNGSKAPREAHPIK
jgi:hypothetical protein